MKLIETINFIPFYEKIKDQKMSALTAYRVSKIYKAVKDDAMFYQEKLQQILNLYGEVDENGKLVAAEDGTGIKLKPDKQNECIEAINELQDLESNAVFELLPMDVLSELQLTPSEIEEIMGFIA